MKTHEDGMYRVVSLDNLVAMCEAASGTCHRYWIAKVSRSRVHVGYSNPDEYGNEAPMYAILPCFPSGWPGDAENPRVLIHCMRVIGDSWNGAGWQAFEGLWGFTVLWPTDAGVQHRETLPLDDVGAPYMAHLRAVHAAYHKVHGGAENCHVCAEGSAS